MHSVLGRGSVLEQLKNAKELRNRWKTADLSEPERAQESIWSPKRPAVRPLRDYDFDRMLSDIFVGLENGCLLAQEHVQNIDQTINGHVQADGSHADWDFIVDAMDWEAV